jgi:DNA-binding CsgD family transcriptional regulator
MTEMSWDTELFERITIRSPKDIRRAAEAFDAAARERGFRIAACADIASSAQMVDAEGASLNADVFGWKANGERWWEVRRLALNSPLPRACRYESEPFWCNEEGAHTPWHNKYLDELSFATFGQYVKAGAAIVIPVHLPFGQIGACSLTPIDLTIRDLTETLAEYGELFSALCRRFLGGYVNALRSQQWIPSDCRLSKREVECLRWAAIGKTDKEISLILTLSHATVRYHIQRAGEKLNAVNRSQSVFKAGQLGYLGAAA